MIFCSCGKAMYLLLDSDGETYPVCEGCDPHLMDAVSFSADQ